MTGGTIMEASEIMEQYERNKAFYNGYIDDRTAWERVKVFGNTNQARIRVLTSYEVKLLLNNCLDIDLERFDNIIKWKNASKSSCTIHVWKIE